MERAVQDKAESQFGAAEVPLERADPGSRPWFEAVVGQLGDTLVAVLDRDLRIQLVAGTLPDGTPKPRQWLGRLVEDVLEPPDAKALLGPLQDGLAGRASSLEAKSGPFGWWSVEITPLRDAGGVERVLAVARNIDARRRQAQIAREAEHRSRRVVEALPVPLALADLDGTVVWVNDAACESFGYGRSQLEGMHLAQLAAPGERDELRDRVAGAAAGADGSVTGQACQRADGTTRWMDVRIVAVDGLHASADLLVSTWIDVGDRVRGRSHPAAGPPAVAGEGAPGADELRWRAAFDGAPLGMVELDAGGRVVQANAAFAALTGADAGMVGQPFLSTVHPSDRAAVADRLDALWAGAPVDPAAHRIAHPGGTPRWAVIRGGPLRDGGAATLMLHLVDVTDEHESTERLLATNARFAALVEHGSDLILILNEEGRVRYASPAAANGFGLDRARLLGTSISDWLTLVERPRIRAIWADLLAEPGSVRTFETPVREPSGRELHLEITMSNRVADPAVQGVVCNCRDVTERVVTTDRLTYQALHDGLTGLPNRTLFLDRLESALARGELTGQRTALLFLDLDRFKRVNDSMGHAAGDEVMVVTASRLADAIRPGDSVARIGGDEFVVLAEAIDTEASLLALAERIRRVVAEPIELPGRSVTVGASVGVAVSNGADPQALLREADTALYRAKELGRDRWELFNEEMRAAAAQRLDTEELLRATLRTGNVEVMFQPIVDLAAGVAVGAEALCRIRDGDGREVPPSAFIPIAEDSGLVIDLGLEVLARALTQQAAAAAAGRGGYVAVNISARQLAHPDTAQHVARALEASGVPPSQLCLELTETSLIDGGSQTRTTIDTLDAMGIALALDDFGTGWSSLSYLDRFPLRTVKIDRSFVAALGADGEGRAIVGAIIGLARALRLSTVAEGVETETQAAALRALGCDYAQGFLFGRPGPPEEQLATGLAWRSC